MMNSRLWKKAAQAVLMGWVLGRVLPVLAQECPPPPAPFTEEEGKALKAEAKDRGFLWRIEKGGHSGYLYSSIHASKKEWALLGPKTMAAVLGSDAIALELDVMDPEVQKQMGAMLHGGIKPVLLPADLQKRMDALAEKVCVTTPDLDKQHAVIQLVAVTLADARFAGFEIAYGTESFLAGLGHAMGKPVISLEKAGTQLKALLGGTPAEIVADTRHAMTILEDGRGRAKIQRLGDAWANSDLKDLESYQQWCECADTASEKRSLAHLNDDRNPGMAAAIDKIISGGHSVFVAVGALHMTGAKGLPLLMRQKGYKVERVEFKP